MSENDWILAAVDGTEGSLAAVRYAASEAKRLETGLRLLHVAPDYMTSAALYAMPVPFTPDEFATAGNEILGDALDVATPFLPSDLISLKLVYGDRVAGILEAANEARIIVLGSERSSVIERISVGSVVGGVAAHASIPVVAVPSDWPPASPKLRVGVGVKAFGRVPEPLLREAFRAASERGAALEIVHVWELSNVYGSVIFSVLDLPEWQVMVERDIREGAAGLFEEFSDVKVEVRSEYGHPAEVLKELSAEVDLLFIARRAHGFPTGQFGSTGRALLRESRCPVEVLPVAEIEE